MLLMLLVAIVWSANQTRLERQAELTAQSASLAASVSTSLDQYLGAAYALGSTLAQHDAVRSLDPVASQRLFASVLREQPSLVNVVLGDSSARLLATANSNSPAQRRALDFVHEALRDDRPVLSDLFVASTTGMPLVTLAYPVHDERGALTGMLGLALDLPRIQGAFSAIPVPRGSVVTVMDRSGRIIARSRDAARYVGQQGVPASTSAETPSIRDVDGVERLAADAALQRVPWRVSVGIPLAEVRARSLSLWTRNLAIVALIFGAIIVASMLMAISGTRSLEALRTQARRIAAGDLTPPAPLTMPNLELGQLQDAFVTMASSLRQAREAAERQVEQERRLNRTLQSLQQHVVRQERQAAVGQLMHGMAHEMNNPLQAILGTAQLLARRPELSADVREEIALVQSQAVRAREIVRSLSTFNDPQLGSPEPVDLREVVSEVVRMRRAGPTAGDIRVTADSQTSAAVQANFTELVRVVLNLVTNAEQALLEAGTLMPVVRIRLFNAGTCVRVEVADNGPGVPRELEPRLFQPFVTTRGVGHGTGLGLCLSHGIVHSYGGTIGYHRNDLGGATFYFELPAIVTGHHVHDPTPVLRQPAPASFDATVVRTAPHGANTAVWLDCTAFYPTSGGQPHDLGTLADAPVVDVQDDEAGDVMHLIAGVAPESGAAVHGAIDWTRRFDHMQQHTGQHLLSAVIEHLFSIRTVSFHLGSESSTIDLDRELTLVQLARVEHDANAIIWRDSPVSIRFVTAAEAELLPLRKETTRSGTVRLVEIAGVDLSACGGTHVERTGAIGQLALTAWERFKGGQRLEFLCGHRALARFQQLRDVTAASIRQVSVLPGDIPAAIERLQQELKEQKRVNAALHITLAGYQAVTLANDPEPLGEERLVLQVVDADATTLKALAVAIAQRSGHVAVLVSRSTPVLAVAARAVDATSSCQDIIASLATQFGGRGGGKPDLAQCGALRASADDVLAAARVIIGRLT